MYAVVSRTTIKRFLGKPKKYHCKKLVCNTTFEDRKSAEEFMNNELTEMKVLHKEVGHWKIVGEYFGGFVAKKPFERLVKKLEIIEV